jgi:hypothetical protein
VTWDRTAAQADARAFCVNDSGIGNNSSHGAAAGVALMSERGV